MVEREGERGRERASLTILIALFQLSSALCRVAFPSSRDTAIANPNSTTGKRIEAQSDRILLGTSPCPNVGGCFGGSRL